MKVYVSMLDKEYFARGEKAVVYTRMPVLVKTEPIEINEENIIDKVLGSNRMLIKKAEPKRIKE